jgi:hypothetical protein
MAISHPPIRVSPAEIEKIEINARFWHDENPGNTYHSARVTIFETGGYMTVWHTGMRYGSNQAYLQTVQDLLEHLGVATPETRDNGLKEPFWRQMERLGIDTHKEQEAVAARSDLHDGAAPRGFRNLDGCRDM